jgi:RND family efflux transporter MFP subunit
MNKVYTVFLPILMLAMSPAIGAEAPSVQVDVVALKQQAMTDTVSGYGVVSPDTRSQHSISLPRSGQLVSLLVSAGQVVKKGQPLLAFGTGAQAALAYQQARQAVEFSKGEATRVEQLFGQQLATQSQLAAARKALADAQDTLRAQERIGAGQSLERVVAPFDGIVSAVQAAQGERLAEGAPVIQLARSDKERVLLGVEPDDVRRVRPGMAVSVNPVFSTGFNVAGRVAQIFGMINAQSQLVDVLVEIPGAALMPGTRVRADIEIARQTQWVVPRSAVLRDAQGTYFFQVGEGKARRVNVQSGLEKEGLIAVKGAFDPRQAVVSVGNYELHDGMAVRGSAP